MFKPQLMYNTDGKLFLQVSEGQHVATVAVPEDVDVKDSAALKIFLDSVVPDMMRGLVNFRRTEDSKRARRAKNAKKGKSKHKPNVKRDHLRSVE